MRAKEFLSEFIKNPFASSSTSGVFIINVPTGNKGPDVADAQKALVALGHDLPRFGVDGIKGPETANAIRGFQTKAGLPTTGNLDQKTVDALNTAVKQKGIKLQKSTSADVKGRVDARSLPPLSTDSVTQGKIGELLNFIARYESNGNYNIILGGKTMPLTKMTIDQIFQLQRDMVRSGKESSAVGRYQYIRKTLEQEVAQMGLDPSKTLFDEKTQDKIAIHTLRTTARLDDWLAGKQSDEQFLLRLSKIWASLPDPRTGGSFYAGVGSNKAGLGNQTALNTLSKIQSMA